MNEQKKIEYFAEGNKNPKLVKLPHSGQKGNVNVNLPKLPPKGSQDGSGKNKK